MLTIATMSYKFYLKLVLGTVPIAYKIYHEMYINM